MPIGGLSEKGMRAVKSYHLQADVTIWKKVYAFPSEKRDSPHRDGAIVCVQPRSLAGGNWGEGVDVN